MLGCGSEGRRADPEFTPELVDFARTGGTVEDFADERKEVVEGSDRWQGRGEGVVSGSATCGQDEGVADDVEGHGLVVELACEGPVGLPDAAQDARSRAIEVQQVIDVGAPADIVRCHFGGPARRG